MNNDSNKELLKKMDKIRNSLNDVEDKINFIEINFGDISKLGEFKTYQTLKQDYEKLLLGYNLLANELNQEFEVELEEVDKQKKLTAEEAANEDELEQMQAKEADNSKSKDTGCFSGLLGNCFSFFSSSQNSQDNQYAKLEDETEENTPNRISNMV